MQLWIFSSTRADQTWSRTRIATHLPQIRLAATYAAGLCSGGSPSISSFESSSPFLYIHVYTTYGQALFIRLLVSRDIWVVMNLASFSFDWTPFILASSL